MSLTAAQQSLRLSGICSSDIPAVCDLLPETWKNRRTAEDVITEKLGDAPGFEGNARTRKGERMEPIIARLWSEEFGRPLVRNEQTISMPGRPEFLATPDYLTDDAAGEVVECKYVGFFVGKGWGETPPIYVEAQVQWQLGVLGKPRAHVAAFIEGADELVRSYVVEFDPALFEKLTLLAGRCWARVLEARATRNTMEACNG